MPSSKSSLSNLNSLLGNTFKRAFPALLDFFVFGVGDLRFAAEIVGCEVAVVGCGVGVVVFEVAVVLEQIGD